MRARLLPILGLLAALAATRGAAAAGVELLPGFRGLRLDRMPREPLDGGVFEARMYPAFDATEWQIRLRAPADRESPIYEDVPSADFVVTMPVAERVTLHWSRGSHDSAADFEPRSETLTEGRRVVLESFGGRSSDGTMPYFNLAAPGGGLILAVGWTGDWRATFEALGEGRVRVRSGLKRSRFRLPAGESVRLPSLLVMPYAGDRLDGQNRFRRLMLAEFSPAGRPPLELMPVAASVHGMIGFNDTTATNLVGIARTLAAAGLSLDTFWLDAGWNAGGFPRAQGNPDADGTRFPAGLAPVGQAARDAGLRFLAWFEPERAMPGTWLDREHPSWLLTPSGTPPEYRYQEKDGFRLLDLGNPEARRWAADRVSREIHDAGIALYRQDCNLYPAYFWQTEEAPDRVGRREIRHVGGLYDFLDELARRHPGLILDNCASGGRRLDFEMMRRCVALWRSDSCWGSPGFPRNVQAMTHGLSLWLPLHGLGAAATDETALRSGMGACASFAVNFRDPAAVETLRRHLQRYLAVRPLFMKDYYPLTPWSTNVAEVLAFQFHDPFSGRGIVQAFRAGSGPGDPTRLRLRGLEAGMRYAVTDWDATGDSTVDGAALMTAGLAPAFRPDREAVVFEYRPFRSPASPVP